MKTKILLALTMSLTASAALAQSSGFPKYMFSKKGCSESYFKKGRSLNKVMGFSAGAVGIIGSTILPGSALFLIGGLGAAGETGYTYIEENEEVNKKKMAPRVRYPFARQYFDITNALELNKIIEQNKEDEEISEYIPMYIDALFPSKSVQAEYKECKSLGRLNGISRSETKEIEKNLMFYLEQYEEGDKKLSSYEQAKKDMANCFLDIKDGESYPIADLLLLKSELENAKLLSWRFKSATRLYKYTLKQAKKSNLSMSARTFFDILGSLDKEGEICQNNKKPLNRKRLSKEVIYKLEELDK
jgi:hypothetical protein